MTVVYREQPPTKVWLSVIRNHQNLFPSQFKFTPNKTKRQVSLGSAFRFEWSIKWIEDVTVYQVYVVKTVEFIGNIKEWPVQLIQHNRKLKKNLSVPLNTVALKKVWITGTFQPKSKFALEVFKCLKYLQMLHVGVILYTFPFTVFCIKSKWHGWAQLKHFIGSSSVMFRDPKRIIAHVFFFF